jgi:hypothetical protein
MGKPKLKATPYQSGLVQGLRHLCGILPEKGFGTGRRRQGQSGAAAGLYLLQAL